MKRILAVILSLTMVLCMMPGMAFADDSTPVDLTDAEITLSGISNNKAEWTGAKIEPKVTLSLNDTTIPEKNGDGRLNYFVTYEDNINGGIATVRVTGLNGYSGTATKEFTIIKSMDLVALTTPDTVISGTEVSADQIVLYDGTKQLQANRDYKFKDNSTKITITESNKTVTIVGIEDRGYKGEREVVFSIGSDIRGAVVEPVNSLTYTGSTQEQSVRVTLAGTRLTKDIDYRIENNRQKNAGTYKLAVIGKGKYAGKAEADFTIAKKDIKYVTVAPIENQTAHGAPTPEIKDGTTVLTNGTDYELSYQNNAVIGGVATVTINGKGNYTGTIYRNYNIKNALDPSAFSMVKTDYEYTGNIINPEILVNPSFKYRSGIDYKIVGAANAKAGSYKVQIVGTGAYGGVAKTFDYNITVKEITKTNTSLSMADTVTYNGKEQKPAVSVMCDGRNLKENIDYTVGYYNNIGIGTATVCITGKDNYAGSIYKTFRIVGKDLSQLSGTLSQTSYDYDGFEKKPTVTLYDGTKKLTSGVDYTVSYRNNKNAGTGEVIVTGKGNYGGTKTLTFRIIGKPQTVTTLYTRYTKTLKSAPFNLQADHDGDGTLVYKTSDPSVATVSETGMVTITGTGKATITVSTTGSEKYASASKEVYINVKPLKPVIKVTSPAKKQIKVMITKVKGATKYQVRYGANGKYYSKYIVHNENNYAKVYTKIKNRVSGKTYEVKVRAYKTMADGTKVWGDWTSVKKIKAK